MRRDSQRSDMRGSGEMSRGSWEKAKHGDGSLGDLEALFRVCGGACMETA